MNYLLIFYTGNSIKEVTLKKGECITVGTGENDTLRLQDNNLSASHLNLRHVDNGINILSHAPFDIMGNQSVNMILSAGDTVNITERVILAIFESDCNCDSIISLNRLNEVSIGRSSRNDICLKGSLVSSHHAVLRKSKDKWAIKDRQSHNGIFVDGNLITSEKAELNNEAIIFIGGFIIELRNNTLRFKNTPGDVILSPIIINETIPIQLPNRKPYPSFYRSPRIRRSATQKEVEVLAPPSTGTRPSVSWLSVLLPPSMMIMVMLSVATLTKNVNTLFYTLPMSSVSVMMAVINYNGQKKKWLQTQELASKKYQEHLTEKEKEIAEYETTYISTLSSINPGILECIAIAKTLDRRLWERTLTDSDFLNVRLGTGQVMSNVDIKIPQEQLTLEENPFLKEAARLKDRHEILSGIPICHSFLDAPITGLIGEHDDVKKMAWSIIINIVVHHSYEDVNIVCIYPENEKEQWEWIRWLPHVWNSERTRRFMSCTLIDKDNRHDSSKKKGQDKTVRTMLRELSEILKVRQRETSDNRQDNVPKTPFYFLLFADKRLVESSGEQFLPKSSSLGFAVLYAYGDIAALPRECNAIIDCGNLGKGINGSVQMTWEPEKQKTFVPDSIHLQFGLVDKFARSLAPVRVNTSGGVGAPPSSVLLFEGMGVKRVEELNILQRWHDNKSYASLSVPIGIKSNGDVFKFDVHPNVTTTPHGVVAGMSGSGKSEMLTAWLLSLAMHFSPKDLNILLIEFKGNDLSNILIGLPHVAGVVNNLQDSGIIERSLTSLWAEHERRLKIFESVKDLATKSLPAYQEYRETYPNKNLENIPFLIVVLDEFAEFKKQFPEQIDKFIRIARVGRSTGLYMVISTQSPSGIVPAQIESNIGYDICLHTANTSESKELIGTTDAFFISRPGRAYVKVGDKIYEQVQTFYGKVPYNPDKDEKESTTCINLVEINGERVNPQIYDKTIRTSEDIPTEGQVLVAYIREIARANDFPIAKPVWTQLLPPYPDTDNPKELHYLYLSDLSFDKAFHANKWEKCNDSLSFAVGLLDVPEQQKQEPFTLDFANNGHQILFGAPSSGKTTFLQTAILSAALSYTPNQLQFLILDFGSWSMKTFEELPHTLMVAYANDREKLQQAEDYLLNELNTRKELFASQGVGTLEAYQQISGKQLPAIIVAIDNITVLNTQYSDMMDTIVKVASEGGGLGIYLLITCVGSSMFKLDNFIKSKHALELTDPTEYRSLVGATSKQKPGHFPGRGFTKGPLEFQTALCIEGANEGERIMHLREICTAMKDTWNGERASIHEAEAREIDVNELSFSSDSFQIGINKTSKQPVDFAFSEISTCVISGKSDDGRSNVLSLIINALSHVDGKVYLYETDEKISPLYPECITVHNASEADKLISEFADEFDRRSNDDENESYGRIVFCIDDFLGFYRGISQESANILETLTRSGSDFNIHIYMACSADDLAFLNTFRNTVKPFDNCIKKGNAIIVGGNIRDYIAFNDLHNETDIKFSDNEGCIFHQNKVTAIKFARVSKD